MDPLKMYLLLEMEIFHRYVSLPEGKSGKNNGPVVCNDAETQVTQEGSDENTANYSIKCGFVMSS